MTRNVGVLFGGRSVEHEVSVTSARSATAALAASDALTCIPIGVTEEGRWLDPEASARVLEGEDKFVAGEGGAAWSLTPAGGLTLAGSDVRVDVVFPLIHGWGGEDGRLQGALELAGIPYVGSGVAGSAVGMDKIFSRRLFEKAGIPVCGWLAASRDDDRAELAARVDAELGYPVFVKPANGGSSLGVVKAAGPAEIEAAIETAARFDRRLVIERGHDVREVECAVLGNASPEASVLGEIVPSNEFYDFDAKYVDDASELKIPAPLPEGQAARIRSLACDAFRALDLAGFARVDFFVEKNSGEVWLNEVNTLPGFTPISMFPKLWEATGLSYTRLIERLVELAVEADRGDPPRLG